jgi:hypothetical protein
MGGTSGKLVMLMVGVWNLRRGWEHFSFVRFKLGRRNLYYFGMINVWKRSSKINPFNFSNQFWIEML